MKDSANQRRISSFVKIVNFVRQTKAKNQICLMAVILFTVCFSQSPRQIAQIFQVHPKFEIIKNGFIGTHRLDNKNQTVCTGQWPLGLQGQKKNG